MTLKTFFEQFELLADAPNSVKKLRELILQLAVQGNLVHQDQKDESVLSLVEDINTKRKLLLSTVHLKSKQIKPVNTLNRNELLFNIPSTWEVMYLKDLVDPRYSISYGVLVPGIDVENGVPFVRIQDLNTVNPASRPNKSIAPEIEAKYARTRLHGGEILLGVVGSIGKVGIAPKTWSGANIARAVCRIAPISSISKEYLLLVLQSIKIQEYFAESTKTLAQPTLNVALVEKTKIPLPPLAEQKRIVEKVNRLMAMCDRLEEQQKKRRESCIRLNEGAIAQLLSASNAEESDRHWQRICSNFDLFYSLPESIGNLRQAILQLAVQGKLTAQEGGDEPAAILLEKIRTEKEQLIKDGKLKKSRFLPFDIEMPFTLPTSWEWARIDDVSLLVTDGEHATPPRIPSPEIPLATAKNIRDGYLDMSTTDFVSLETAEKCWRRCQPKHGDVLMVCVGATTGRLCLLKEPPKFVLVRSVALVRPIDSYIYPEFLAIAIKSPIGQSQVWKNVKQSAQPCLYINKLQSICVPIPPISEQKRIVAKRMFEKVSGVSFYANRLTIRRIMAR